MNYSFWIDAITWNGPLYKFKGSQVLIFKQNCSFFPEYHVCLIPLFHTGPESHELTRIDKYLDSWLNRTQFVKVLTDSHSP